ncbi:unnamed protein product [Paramecium primaurelia]|uniref:Transmembrane protein n=1 Tax=Paramecium primaurelia TaxID=5886 RepID=A0A8S1LC58_PARPR|nr:unnamed protein product [Paramecium primaurelia]
MIQKKRLHQSMFGALMTVLMFGCIITYIVNKFVQLGRRKEFQTLYSEVYYEEIPIYPLVSDNFTLQFAFQNDNQKNYIDESVYQVNAFMVNRVQRIVDNKTIQNLTKTQIPLNKCAKIGITFEEIEEQLDNVDFSNTYCIDWEKISELSLTGTPDQNNYTYLYVNFKLCVNDTNNSESIICKSKEQIQEKLRRNYIQFQISSYNIDLRNYQQPNVPKVEEVQTTISSQVMKDITLFMQPITTLTEEGLLDELVRKDSTIRYQKSQEIIDFNSDESLATVMIRLSNTENISYRIYPKLQDILAQAGGLWELLMLAFSIIVRPFSQMAFKMEIINSLFNFEGQKQTDQEENQNKNKSFEKFNGGQENIQTNENDVSIMLNQVKSKTSSRFPRGRIKAKTQKADTINCVQTEKSSQNFTNSPEHDKMLQKGINSAFRKFFNVATLKLQFGPFDYLKYLKCGKKEGKYKQLNYSVSKLEKCLDILFIIDKLQEIDKLKMILLSKEQVQLFEFLPKPLISLDPTNHQQGENQQYSSLLKPFKGLKEKSVEAQQVLDQLLENLDDPITNKLISLMDPNLIKLLQIQHEFKKKQSPQILVNDFVEQ